MLTPSSALATVRATRQAVKELLLGQQQQNVSNDDTVGGNSSNLPDISPETVFEDRNSVVLGLDTVLQDRVRIGRCVFIGDGTIIRGQNQSQIATRIGDFVFASRGCIFDEVDSIESCVYFEPGCVVEAGARICDGVVLRKNSVVYTNQRIAVSGVYSGNPAVLQLPAVPREVMMADVRDAVVCGIHS